MKTNIYSILIGAMCVASGAYATDYTWWGSDFAMGQNPDVATGTGDEVITYTQEGSTSATFGEYTNWLNQTEDFTFTSDDNASISFSPASMAEETNTKTYYDIDLTSDLTVNKLTLENLRHFQHNKNDNIIRILASPNDGTSATINTTDLELSGNVITSGTDSSWLNINASGTVYLHSNVIDTNPNDSEDKNVSWFQTTLGSANTKTSLTVGTMEFYTHSRVQSIVDHEDGSASTIENFYIRTGWRQAGTAIYSSKITIDKLTCAGTGSQLTIGDFSEITLTGESEFKGIIVTGWNSKGSKVIIADGAKQTFSGTSVQSGTGVITYIVNAGGLLTVNSALAADLEVAGTLAIGDSSLDAKSILLSNGATILFDLDKYDDTTAMLAITGTAQKTSSTDKIYLTFASNPIDLSKTYELFSFDNSSLDDSSNVLDIEDFILDSSLVESGWEIKQNDNSFVLMATVPEASSLAAILGALALGFISYKKRR